MSTVVLGLVLFTQSGILDPMIHVFMLRLEFCGGGCDQ